jgi:hypothetical protein
MKGLFLFYIFLLLPIWIGLLVWALSFAFYAAIGAFKRIGDKDVT